MEVTDRCFSNKGQVLLKSKVTGRPQDMAQNVGKTDSRECSMSQDFVCWLVGWLAFKEGEIILIGVKNVDLVVVCVWRHGAGAGDCVPQQDHNRGG